MRARLGVVGVLATLTLLGAACGRSGEHNGTSAAAPPTEAVADTSSDDSGGGDPGSEGITVHGHWRLDIHNEDGSLDRRVEFENALVPLGAENLAMFLAGQLVPGPWAISLDSESAPLRPCAAGDTGVNCLLQEADGDVTLDTSTAGELTLLGSVVVDNDSAIDWVRTSMSLCGGTVSPADCGTSLGGGSAQSAFTLKTAVDDPADEFEPVPVTAGQLVQVSVTLSFS